MTRDPKTTALLNRMVAREKRALALRRKVVAKTLVKHIPKMSNGDLKEIEDVLYPILGRLQVWGE